MSAENKITAARTSLVLESPFYGSLALSLKPVSDPTCDTAYTDGRVLGYNPTFIESLSHDRVTALIAHEVSHCACGHPWRRDGRDPKGYNIACDKAINSALKESFRLPDGAVYPNAGEDGKSAEWYYARLSESEQPSPSQGNGQGQAGTGQDTPDPLGEVRDAPTGTDADGDPAPTEQEWKQKTAQAANAAKMAGKLPGGLARQIKDALMPRMDVRSLLLRFFSERSTGDYSWTRPSTRYLAQGLYLPALESKALGEVAIYCDTSGSVDPVSLSYARGIVESVISECSPASVSVWYADTDVCRIDRFAQGDPLEWQPIGGGGTNFAPAISAIDAEGTAACIVYIGDCDGNFPDTPPTIPIIWLSTDTTATVPFGELVPVDR